MHTCKPGNEVNKFAHACYSCGGTWQEFIGLDNTTPYSISTVTGNS